MPLGIVGPGATPATEGAAGREPSDPEPPRRFVVPSARIQRPALSAALRRLVREGGLVLAVDRTSVFLFGDDGEPVRCLLRFHLADRRFESGTEHPPELASEVRAFLSSLSRAEVCDASEQAPPPGAMRDYLRGSGIRALLSLPLRREGRIAGFVSFESTSRPRRWREEDRARAQAIVEGIESALRETSASGADEAERSAAAPPPEERELQSRLPRLRPLEGAALLAAELGEELLELSDLQAGTTQLLGRARSDEERDALLGDIADASARLRRGLERIAEAPHRGMVGTEVVDVGAALAESVRAFARAAGEGTRFVVRPTADELPVRADVRLVARAVRHLVANAARATGRSGTVRLSWEPARVEADGTPTRVARIVVEDDGPGIRPEHLPWIFEPFFTTREKEGARGVGLAAVQAIVEGHGGWVDVRSKVGDGTTMALHLPLVGPEVEEATPDLERAGPSVVVLEPDELTARYFERVLRREGCRVRRVASASAAAELGGPDLVLVDRDRAETPETRRLLRDWRRERPGMEVVIVDHRRGAAPDPGEGRRLRRPFDPDALRALVRAIEPDGPPHHAPIPWSEPDGPPTGPSNPGLAPSSPPTGPSNPAQGPSNRPPRPSSAPTAPSNPPTAQRSAIPPHPVDDITH